MSDTMEVVDVYPPTDVELVASSMTGTNAPRARKSSKSKTYLADTGEEVRYFKKRRLISAFNNMVTLVVGDEEGSKFYVHQHILCAASPFFESACKSEWMKDGTIKLPEGDPDAIQVMMYWIYHNIICLPKNMFDTKDITKESGMDTGPGLLVKLFVLGDKYQMPGLRNDVIDAIVLWTRDGGQLPVKVLAYAWDNSSRFSMLRKQLITLVKVRLFVYQELSTARDDLPPEFWCDFALDCFGNTKIMWR